MDMLDDLSYDGDKAQKMRTDEISGDRYQFHSLPKEFQDWHNIFYQLEIADPNINTSAITKANLNAYMWLSIADATYYGMAMTFALLFSVIKLKIAFSLAGFLVSMLFFAPVLLYVGYHFVFYAVIRAQIVGALTSASSQSTTMTFYTTFYGILVSITAAFLFMVLFARDMLVFVALWIKSINGPTDIPLDGYSGYGLDSLIFIHNIIVQLIGSSEDPFYNNIFFITIVFLSITVGIVFLIENRAYKQHKEEVDQEVYTNRKRQGYPIQHAQRLISEWREKHGI